MNAFICVKPEPSMQSLLCCLAAIAVDLTHRFFALLVVGSQGHRTRACGSTYGALFRGLYGGQPLKALRNRAGPFTLIAHTSPKVKRKLLICLVLVRLELL